MSSAVAVEVKGWCPGVLTPMLSGDGLLVRIKPWCGAFTSAQATGIADIAVRLGNGHIDLTRRANLQIRGLREQSLGALREALGRLDLLDVDAATETARNVMVGPLAGDDVRILAHALTRAIVSDRRLAALPAKFGWVVDGDGPLSIVGERADVALFVMSEGVALRSRGAWLGIVSRDQAVKAATGLALGERPLLSAMSDLPTAGARHLGPISGFFGIGAPFGRLEAAQLRRLAATPGVSELRLSPWRALYLDAPVEDLTGLIVDGNDPLLRIEACPGAPACSSSSVDTRRDALRLAARGFKGTIHVSGCAKGCARSASADLTLVGEGGRYGVVHNGTTRDAVECSVEPGAL
jgi:precorrin-3B synthase